MSGVVIGWKQTASERYDTTVNSQAHALIELVGTIVESEGGCHLHLSEESGCLPAEEYVLIDGADADRLAMLREQLGTVLGHPETLTIEAEGKRGVNIA